MASAGGLSENLEGAPLRRGSLTTGIVSPDSNESSLSPEAKVKRGEQEQEIEAVEESKTEKRAEELAEGKKGRTVVKREVDEKRGKEGMAASLSSNSEVLHLNEEQRKFLEQLVSTDYFQMSDNSRGGLESYNYWLGKYSGIDPRVRLTRFFQNDSKGKTGNEVLTEVCKKYKVPLEILYIAFVESGWDGNAKNSDSTATGYWQFIDTTAKGLNLNLGDRKDMAKSTDAAARLVLQIKNTIDVWGGEYGFNMTDADKWFYVLCIWHGGPDRVKPFFLELRGKAAGYSDKVLEAANGSLDRGNLLANAKFPYQVLAMKAAVENYLRSMQSITVPERRAVPVGGDAGRKFVFERVSKKSTLRTFSLEEERKEAEEKRKKSGGGFKIIRSEAIGKIVRPEAVTDEDWNDFGNLKKLILTRTLSSKDSRMAAYRLRELKEQGLKRQSQEARIRF